MTTSQNDPSDPPSRPIPPDGIWATLSVAGVPTAVVAPDGTVDWCNPAFADLAERSPDAVVSRLLVDSLGLERPDRFLEELGAAGRGEHQVQRLEVEAIDWAGTKRFLAISASLTGAWAEPGRVVVVAEDLTAERRGQHRSESGLEAARRASEDGLTGLPNRGTFEGLLESSLRRAVRSAVPLAVMTCDLDGFHLVNDRLGDAAGDQLLQLVASRLSHVLRHNDVLARFTADEFIVVAEEVPDDAMGHQVARRLAAAIADPMVVGGVDVRIGVSIGFTIASGHERPTDLLLQAEQALRGAKLAGKGCSRSLTDVTKGTQPDASTIDWNELALTAREDAPE